MNEQEVALVLDRLGTAFSKEIPGEALDVWIDHTSGVAPEIAVEAVDAVIASSEFFPTVKAFLDHARRIEGEHAEAAALASYHVQPPGPCRLCEGVGWYRTQPHKVIDRSTGELMWANEQWKPCDQCNHVACEQVPRWRAERRRALRHYDEEHVAATHVGAAQARQAHGVNP